MGEEVVFSHVTMRHEKGKTSYFPHDLYDMQRELGKPE